MLYALSTGLLSLWILFYQGDKTLNASTDGFGVKEFRLGAWLNLAVCVPVHLVISLL